MEAVGKWLILNEKCIGIQFERQLSVLLIENFLTRLLIYAVTPLIKEHVIFNEI